MAEKPGRLDRQEFEMLCRFKDEASRGLVHTESWKELMAEFASRLVRYGAPWDDPAVGMEVERKWRRGGVRW